MLRVKEVLKERKVSQIELAEKLEITTVGLNKIINGNPTAETLIKIANALDVDVKDLFVSTRETESETIFVNRDGNFIPVGFIKKDF